MRRQDMLARAAVHVRPPCVVGKRAYKNYDLFKDRNFLPNTLVRPFSSYIYILYDSPNDIICRFCSLYAELIFTIN